MDDHRDMAPFWRGDLFILDGRAFADFIPGRPGEIRPVCLGTIEEIESETVRPLAQRLISQLQVPDNEPGHRAGPRGGSPEKPKFGPEAPRQGILPL